MNSLKSLILLILSITIFQCDYAMIKDLPELTPRGSRLAKIMPSQEKKESEQELALKRSQKSL